MKPKALILMGVAVTCGLGASYMTSRLLAERGGDSAEQVAVLVAKKPLPVGEVLKKPDDWFVEKSFTKGQEPLGAFDAVGLEQLKNKTMKRSLRAGDFILPTDLVNDKDQIMDPPAGYRAVGIRVDAESIAAGWASLPLSRVDIIHTVRKSDEKTTYSQVILENVLVLAADANVNRPENGQATLAQVVTVALKPEDVLKVTLAGETGKMRLMLRKMSDGSKIENGRLTAEQLRTGDMTEEPTETIAKAEPKAEPKIEPKIEPKVEEKKPAPIVVEEPRGDRHVLKIIDGDTVRHQEYLLDKNKNVIAPEISKSELTPPRPQASPSREPAASAPPEPQPQPVSPKAPAPKNDNF